MTNECLEAFSTNFSDIFPPAAKKVIFTLEKSKVSKLKTSCSLFLKFIHITNLI